MGSFKCFRSQICLAFCILIVWYLFELNLIQKFPQGYRDKHIVSSNIWLKIGLGKSWKLGQGVSICFAIHFLYDYICRHQVINTNKDSVTWIFRVFACIWGFCPMTWSLVVRPCLSQDKPKSWGSLCDSLSSVQYEGLVDLVLV